MIVPRIISIFPFLLSLCSLMAAPEQVAMLNPGFEEGGEGAPPKGWLPAVGNPNYAVSEHDGLGAAAGRAALLCATSGDYAAVSQATAVRLVPGATYKLSAQFLSRAAANVEPGGYWLRLVVRNTANLGEAYILANEYADAGTLSPGTWVTKELTWSAPADLSSVPVIADGIKGTKPDTQANLATGSYAIDVLVGCNYPNIPPDDIPRTVQTWVDDVKLTRSRFPANDRRDRAAPTRKTPLLSKLHYLAMLVCPVLNAMPPEPLVWDSPSLGSAGSMPIGNGDIGLNVWAEADGTIRTYIAKTDAWDGANPHFPALRSAPLALSGASRTKQIPSSKGMWFLL